MVSKRRVCKREALKTKFFSALLCFSQSGRIRLKQGGEHNNKDSVLKADFRVPHGREGARDGSGLRGRKQLICIASTLLLPRRPILIAKDTKML